MDFKSIQGLNSCTTEASLMKLDVIYIYFMFHEILFSGNLVMAPDNVIYMSIFC